MYSVSVIIPVYNVEKHIERCLRSLFEQTLQSIEYIFVDDCSPDNSIDILNKMIEEYPNRKKDITLIKHASNKGIAAVRNIGSYAAKGEYIIHCDSDDWVSIDAYKIMYEKAKKTEADIVICGFNYIYPKEKIRIIPTIYSTVDETLRASLSGTIHNSVWNKMIRRDIYIKNNIKCFDGIDMFEDTCIIPRLIYNSTKIEYVEKCLYNYNLCNENSYTNEWKNKSLLDIIYVTDFLVDFFTKDEITKKINLEIECNYLKLQTKLLLLLHSNKVLRKQYCNKYNVAIKYIWYHPSLNIMYKILLYISSYSYKTMSLYIEILILLRKVKRKLLS